MNKYKKWYSSITKRGQETRNLIYTEKHHILPKCLGGTDDPANITALTAREHFIAHWLLTKIHYSKERYLLLNALQGMRRENPNQERYHTKITARVYAHLKEEWSQLSSERVKGENNPMYGDKFRRSDEGKARQRQAILGGKNGSRQDAARKKISASKLGKKRDPFSDEWKAKLSAAKSGENNNRYGVEVSVETRKKIGDKIRGRKQTQEEKARRSAANIGSKREKALCPHCQQMIAVNVYPRWHGDNCKLNQFDK